MKKSILITRALGATLGFGLLAGCAVLPHAASAPTASAAPAAASPQLAGAWYQVYFATDKTDLDDRGQMIVKNVASVANANATTRVTVIGKTDSIGTAAANMTLSRRRADQVRDALVAAGVPAARIDTSWTGEGTQDKPTANDVVERRDRVVDITVALQDQ